MSDLIPMYHYYQNNLSLIVLAASSVIFAANSDLGSQLCDLDSQSSVLAATNIFLAQLVH